MSSGIAAAIDRVTTARRWGRAGHLGAILIVGVTIMLAELKLTDFDHGTHLLAGLLLVAGSALLFGPGPAVSGLTLGAGTSLAIGGALVEGLLVSPHAYIQVLLYLMAGGAVIALAAVALRARGSGPSASAVPAGHAAAVLEEPLTPRETEILRLAASGIPVDEIAAELFLSPNTVKTHLTHVYAKLGVRGRPDAIRAALHYGCLGPSDICPHRFPPQAEEAPVPPTSERRHP